jgi:DNA uptake protein ComE-like DNA-binding protein
LGCGTSWCDLGSGLRPNATTVKARGTCRHHSGKTRESHHTGTSRQQDNLNTATATELDTLPQIGPARAKAIVEARIKGKFKSWDDFVARKVVPSNAEAAIKDLVSF